MQRKTPQTSDIDDETLFAKVERGILSFLQAHTIR